MWCKSTGIDKAAGRGSSPLLRLIEVRMWVEFGGKGVCP